MSSTEIAILLIAASTIIVSVITACKCIKNVSSPCLKLETQQPSPSSPDTTAQATQGLLSNLIGRLTPRKQSLANNVMEMVGTVAENLQGDVHAPTQSQTSIASSPNMASSSSGVAHSMEIV